MRSIALGFALLLVACESDSHDKVFSEVVVQLDEMDRALAGVDDDASAAASKQKLEEIRRNIQALAARSQALPEPTADEKRDLEKNYRIRLTEWAQGMARHQDTVMLYPELAEPLMAMQKDIQGLKK